MEELVIKSEKGNPVTTSLLVAKKFKKNHKDVLRDIQNLSCSQAFRERNFALSYYKSRQNKKLPMYIMTKDGFTFLVMGYTGEAAGRFKEDFIDAFNNMATQLKKLSDPVNFTRLQLLEMAIESEKKAIANQDKASYADRVLEHDNQLVDIGQAAKLLKLPFGRNKFFERLRKDGIFFNNRNEPKQQYLNYFDVRKESIPRDNHPSFTVLKVLVKPKGLYWLSKRYGGNYHDGIPQLKIH